MGFFGRTSKRSGRVRLGALAMAAAIALACHYFDEGDSGSSFASPSQFEGTWKGTLVELITAPTLPPFVTHELQINFDSVSVITSVLVDDVDAQLTGTVSFVAGVQYDGARFYNFELTHDVTGAVESVSFYIEERFGYGLAIYPNGDFAVLQRDDPDSRPFEFKDLAYHKAGFTGGIAIEWDTGTASEITLEDIRRWDMETCPSPPPDPEPVPPNDCVLDSSTIPYEGDIGGVDRDTPGDLFSGTFQLTNFDPEGVWKGFDDAPPVDTYPLVVVMSYDKEFAGTYECDPDFPMCIFTIWNFATTD